ncbi:recombinase family protein [uncultured Anaerotruncus sp.]|uniref:recombinase family protein n=1 Tax=uncultured Anaerotruncus sp. TaxID=905011 RepID=UPI00280B2138|nr:recombinase family protein [uncultured Anaerotruncus sp.]
MSAARAALYLRLSKEDGDRDGASQSIRNQRDFLLDYCGKNGLPVVEIYADDGYTGTNFNRPGFLRMVEDIEAGRVDTVLTKDLSRLGRDYILTGYYLERYFPERGVRYIAVNDRIDTAAEQSDMTPFRAVFNDLYAKDISRKVRAALQTRRQMGKFIGTYPPYGYRKDPADRNRLVIEEEEAAQVRRIYAWFLGGQTVSAIARRLTEQGVPTPSAGKRMACGQKPGAGWSYPMVRRILSMPTYRGDLVSRMSQKVSYKLSRVRRLPREEWLVAEGTHEAIVSPGTFERAQELLAVRGYAARRKSAEPKPLTGLFFCADCGAPMTLWSNGKARYFVCSGWKRNPGEHRCAAHYLREETVLEAVRSSLAGLLTRVRDPARLAEEAAGPTKASSAWWPARRRPPAPRGRRRRRSRAGSNGRATLWRPSTVTGRRAGSRRRRSTRSPGGCGGRRRRSRRNSPPRGGGRRRGRTSAPARWSFSAPRPSAAGSRSD